MNIKSLIYIPHIKPNARFRLLCFPYAGGGATTYLRWQKSLPSEIELAVIQPPGRGLRLIEPSFQTMEELVSSIFEEFKSLKPKPTAFYGHSMGARVAYELIIMLYQQNLTLPYHLFASGSVAPCVEKTEDPIFHLPKEHFIEKLRSMGGTPDEVLSNSKIMELLLPALRADFKIIETYVNKAPHSIPTTVSVFLGDQEVVDDKDIAPWFDRFTKNTGTHMIKGGHFFVDKNSAGAIKELSRISKYPPVKPGALVCEPLKAAMTGLRPLRP